MSDSSKAAAIEEWLASRKYQPQRSEMRRMLHIIRALESEKAALAEKNAIVNAEILRLADALIKVEARVKELEADCERHRLAAVDFRAIAEKAEADLAAHHRYVSAVSEGIAGVPCPVCVAGRESGDTNGSRAAGTTPDREGPTPSAAVKPAARDPDDERERAG